MRIDVGHEWVLSTGRGFVIVAANLRILLYTLARKENRFSEFKTLYGVK